MNNRRDYRKILPEFKDKVELYTSEFHFNFRDAAIWSRVISNDSGIYYTPVKGLPKNPSIPSECWAFTNRFDPSFAEAVCS